jgi:hypothetical protein
VHQKDQRASDRHRSEHRLLEQQDRRGDIGLVRDQQQVSRAVSASGQILGPAEHHPQRLDNDHVDVEQPDQEPPPTALEAPGRKRQQRVQKDREPQGRDELAHGEEHRRSRSDQSRQEPGQPRGVHEPAKAIPGPGVPGDQSSPGEGPPDQQAHDRTIRMPHRPQLLMRARKGQHQSSHARRERSQQCDRTQTPIHQSSKVRGGRCRHGSRGAGFPRTRLVPLPGLYEPGANAVSTPRRSGDGSGSFGPCRGNVWLCEGGGPRC